MNAVPKLPKRAAASTAESMKESITLGPRRTQPNLSAGVRFSVGGIPTAVTATTDFAVVTAGRAGVCAAVRLLGNLNHAIQQYDRQIDQLAKGHPDFALFQSMPGAGKVLVPRLIAAFGTQRDRYQRAAEIQQYSGIAPVTEASGQQ